MADPDTIITMRLGRLCTIIMGAIKYGVENAECIVDDVAARAAGEFVSELLERGEVKAAPAD